MEILTIDNFLISLKILRGYVTKTLEISKNRGVLYFNDVCPDATNVIGDDTWSRGVYDVFSFNCSNVFQGCPGTQASYTSIRVCIEKNFRLLKLFSRTRNR